MLKKSLLSVSIAFFCATNAYAVELNNTTQKASYTLGSDMAKNFANQGINIDIDALVAGMNDVINQKPLRLTDAEMEASILDLKKELLAKQAAKEEKIAQQNAQKGQAFLAKNKNKAGIKTLANGIQYRVIEQGTGSLPAEEDYITAHYRGTLIDGTEFDSSYSRGTPIEFQMSNVIKGWGEVLKRMPVGSKWEAFIPHNLAYGKKGAGKTIGPNETLIFTIELIKTDKNPRSAG